MAWSSPTLLGSGSDNTAATSRTLATSLPVVAGQLVVVFLSTLNGAGVTGFTITDSDGVHASNSYTIHTEFNAATITGAITIAWCIAAVTTTLTSLTIARSGANNITSIAWGAAQWSGNKPSAPEDAAVWGGGTAAAQGTSASPSLTANAPAQAGDLILCATEFVDTGAVTTYAESATLTNLFKFSAGAANAALGCGYVVNSGSGATAYAPSLSASRKWATAQIGFAALPSAFNSNLMMMGAG